MSTARGVVFDLDGVLVLSEHLWEEAWVDYAGRFDVAWSLADTRGCQGLSVPEWAGYLAARTSGDPDDAAEAVIGYVAGAYDSGRVSLIGGAAEMVAAVADRVPIALASSAPRRIIDTVMHTMGIGPAFSATVSSAEVARGKPSPDVYLEAIRRLGVAAAASLAVEDSSNGIRAAAAAGLTVIGVAHEQYPIAPDAIRLTHSVQHSLPDVHAELLRLLDAAQPQQVER